MAEPFDYPDKLLRFWADAFENDEVLESIIQTEVRELGVCVHAMRGDLKALEWLIDNNYPHLRAFCEAVMGNDQAMLWLKRFNYHWLYLIALFTRDNVNAYDLLEKNSLEGGPYLKLAKAVNSQKKENADSGASPDSLDLGIW